MARRVRKRRRPRQPESALRPEDYQFANESRLYWQAVGGTFALFGFAVYWTAFFAIRTGPGAWIHGKFWVPAAILVYPFLALWVAQLLAVRPRRQELKEAGMQARVLTRSHPQLKEMLSQQAKLLMIDEPEMYVIDDETPYIFSMPSKTGAIVATRPLLETMNEAELSALLAREMGHIAAHHVRMAFTARWMRRANPALKVLLLPVTLMCAFLGPWLNLIEVTADRVAILVTGRPALVNAALVKLAVAADREAEISQEELEAYMRAGLDITTDSAQMERHFRVGEFLSSQRELRERIEEITNYLHTDEGQEALQKMQEMKQRIS